MTQNTGQAVLDAFDREAMVELAKDMVAIPSFKEEETPVARFLADYFEKRGYEVQLQELEPGRFQTVARLKGTGGGKSLMFNGHIDIDPIAYGWRRDPWVPSVEGDRLYGGGIRNMKGGVASMIEAAEMIRRSGQELKGDIVVACVVGELQGGVGTVHLCKQGPLTDMAIVPEPHGADNIVTAHAGVIVLAVHTIGKSRHTSRKHDAVDALQKMLTVIPALNGMELTHTPRSDMPELPLVNIGVIMGGMGRDYDLKGPNFTSDFVSILVDVRTLPGMTKESVISDIRGVLEGIKAQDPEFEYEIEEPAPAVFKANKVVFPPFDMPTDEYIVDAVKRQYRNVTGKEPEAVGTVLPYSYTGNDSAHLWQAGVPCLLIGPEGFIESLEVPDTYVLISEMEQVSKVLALTAAEVCNLEG